MFIGIDSINEKSKNIVNNAVKDYQTMRENDRIEKANSLKPGENLGFATNRGFYSSNNMNKCDSILAGYRAELNGLLNDVKTEIKRKTAEPPTTEQANLLVALSVGKPTKEELQNAIENNISNYATFSALNRLAAENGYYFDNKSPVDDLRDVEFSLSNNINRLYITNAENTLTPTAVQFVDFMQGVF